jgi:hypothetical protein
MLLAADRDRIARLRPIQCAELVTRLQRTELSPLWPSVIQHVGDRHPDRPGMIAQAEPTLQHLLDPVRLPARPGR